MMANIMLHVLSFLNIYNIGYQSLYREEADIKTLLLNLQYIFPCRKHVEGLVNKGSINVGIANAFKKKER